MSELLIALAILGVIAAFTIPKVLQAQQDQQKKAVFKETLATLAQVTEEAARTRAIVDTASKKAFFRTRLNYAKLCATDPNAEGCWSGDGNGAAAHADAYVLHNGAMITSINGGDGPSRETVLIDWNGLKGPNLAGEDILGFTTCFGPASCDTGYAAILGSGPKGSGVLGPNTGASLTLYESLFR